MTSTQRILKRTVIIFVYLVIFSAIFTLGYFIFRTPPTCQDLLKNQGEEGVDCGGPCAKCEPLPDIQNIKILEKSLIPTGASKYDALVKIENPNALFGIASLEYSMDFLDASGKVLARKEGNSFLLPEETKYIFAFGAQTETKPATLELRVTSFRWQKFNDYQEPDLPVYQKEFNFISGGSGFARLTAKFQNRSGYDFRKIITKAVIRDTDGNPIAINETSSNDVRANEEREVSFSWPEPFSENMDVRGIEVNSEANVFDEDNFMRKYGSSDQYESYGAGMKY